MAKGTVKWFNAEKGYGFITVDGGSDIFAHHSQILTSGYRTLEERMRVEFDVGQGTKGAEAQGIHPLGSAVQAPAQVHAPAQVQAATHVLGPTNAKGPSPVGSIFAKAKPSQGRGGRLGMGTHRVRTSSNAFANARQPRADEDAAAA